MTLCWNDDGTMCGPEELRWRIQAHLRGEYKPELRNIVADRRYKELTTERREYLNAKYSNYPWPWLQKKD